jgi:putative membrane protein
MMKFITALAVGVLSVGASAAPASSASDDSSMKDEGKILSELHLSNLSEIQMGKLAEQKATSSEAKELAQRLISDHTQIDQELQQLAEQRGITLSEPSADSKLEGKQKKAQEMLNDMNKTDVASFDEDFAKMAVHQHQADVKQLQAKGKKLAEGPVKSFIDRTVPVLNQHLQMAKNIKEKS